MFRSFRVRAFPRIAGLCAVAGAAVVPASASAATHKLGSRPLREGTTGPDVRALQHTLTEAGFATPATGRFDARTARAVSRFERQYHLAVDGVASSRLIRVLRQVRELDVRDVDSVRGSGGGGLMSGSAGATDHISRKRQKAKESSADPTKVLNNPVLAPVTQDGKSAHLGNRTLRPGMKGHDVRVLQSYLTLDGYATAIDGQYGPTTLTSVKKFESANNLTANGVITYAQSLTLRQDVSDAITSSDGATTGQATLNSDGTATAPAGAPAVVQQVIAAANQIIDTPYIYGGGHASFNSPGYDCSGSASYALHGGGLLSSPEDSTELESFGVAGKGNWITVYSDSGHAFIVVAGLAFDTAHYGTTTPGGTGPRWLPAADALTNLQYADATGGPFIARHPAGL